MGRIFNDSGEGLSPTYSCKKGVRYRYYTARSRVQGQRGEGGSSIQRLPAGPIEALVLEQLSASVDNGVEATDRDLVAAMLEKIVVHRDAVILTIRDPGDLTSPAHAIRVPWQKPDSHRRHDIIAPAEAAEDPTRLRVEDRDRLLRSIATARHWAQELIEGAVADLPELARREERSERSVRMTLSLAFLDPAIIAAVCDRRLPRGYRLTKLADLPSKFDDQWRALGLPRPA